MGLRGHPDQGRQIKKARNAGPREGGNEKLMSLKTTSLSASSYGARAATFKAEDQGNYKPMIRQRSTRILLTLNLLFLLIPARADVSSAIQAYQAQDYAQALSQFAALAGQGDAMAQYYLGIMYAGGQGTAQDMAHALIWIRKAADAGLPRAEFKIGLAYASGLNVDPDTVTAYTWFKRAADQGYPPAEFYLAVALEKGMGTLKNEAEAIKWYWQAARHGLQEAQVNLGNMYSEGRGIAPDPVQAYAWYSVAAVTGSEEAARNRGLISGRMSKQQIRAAGKLARELFRDEVGK